MRKQEWEKPVEEKGLFYRWLTRVIVLVMLVILGGTISFFYARKVNVPNANMEPTLKELDSVWLDRMSYLLGKPAREQVIAYENKDGEIKVARVIGLPGESVLIKDGLVYINDQLLMTSVNQEPLVKVQQEEIRFTLEADAYFVLGDNRRETTEVIYANMVHVKKEQILGRVWLRIKPKISFVADK
ncbi:MAG: signal peptidase I [Lachnospiraceae bacterium]|nr:signal peptidase I [Lachnospiraceae bacterium]MDY5742280.1 signal peptidase I [Lachnospiraceae bacterium]